MDDWWVRWVGQQAPSTIRAPCYWLVREIYHRDLGIALPPLGLIVGRQRWRQLILDGLIAWTCVHQPHAYDGVLLALPGEFHLGVWVPDDRILHLGRHMAGAAVQHLSLYHRRGFLRGIYRLRS